MDIWVEHTPSAAKRVKAIEINEGSLPGTLSFRQKSRLLDPLSCLVNVNPWPPGMVRGLPGWHRVPNGRVSFSVLWPSSVSG